MTEMKRLLDEPFSAEAERLLRSAAKDGPASRAAAAQTLAKIDALSSTAAVTASWRERSSFRAILQASAWGVFGLVVAFGGVVAARSLSSTAPAPSNPGSHSEAPLAAPAAAGLAAGPSATGVRVEDLPSAVAKAEDERAVAHPGPRLSAEPAGSSRLEEELATIDEARAALASGRADAALARVVGYQRRFRDGSFAEEAEALEIQALAAMGRRAEAQAKGERFLAARPGSPYERRVRSSIASEETRP